MKITVYQLVQMAKDNAELTGNVEAKHYFQAMLELMTIEEASQPAAYYGVRT